MVPHACSATLSSDDLSSAHAEQGNLRGGASHGGKQRAIGSARSSHRRAAAAVESVQQRLQGLASRVFAGVGPEGARGHDTAGGKLQRGADEAVAAMLQLCGGGGGV